MGRATLHEEEDDALRPSREVRLLRGEGVDGLGGAQQAVQSESAEPGGGAMQHGAAAEASVESGGHESSLRPEARWFIPQLPFEHGTMLCHHQSMSSLTHLDPAGKASMVDISDKKPCLREAIAEGRILLQADTLRLIQDNGLKKGDVLAVARIAGIQAAKQTQHLIPLCHQIPLSKVAVDFEILATGIHITGTVKTTAATGVEMEALTAVSIAALTLYDMCKAVDKAMQITDIRLLSKTKTPLP